MKGHQVDNHRVLVVGGSRGLADEFLKSGDSVVVTVRSEVSQTSDDESLLIFRLELNTPAHGDQLIKALGNGSFDAIVLSAGIFGPDLQRVEQASESEIEALFMTNAISPVRLARQLLPSVRSGGVIAFMSSRTASIALNEDGDMELYRASKSALNALARSFAIKDGLPAGVGVLLLHPGWVQTGIGGTEAPLTIAESVPGLRRTILAALDRPAFQFQNYLGETLPW